MNDNRHIRRGRQQAKSGHDRQRSSSSASGDRSEYFRFDARINAPDFVLQDMEDELEYGPLDDELTYEDDGDFLDSLGVQPEPEPKVTRKSYNRPHPQPRQGQTGRRPAQSRGNSRQPAQNRRPVEWQEPEPYFEEDELDQFENEPVFGPADRYDYGDGDYDDDYYDESYEMGYAYPPQRRANRPIIRAPQPRQLVFALVGIIVVAMLLVSRPLTSSFMEIVARNQTESISASVPQADTISQDDSQVSSGLWGGRRTSQLSPFFSQSVLYWEDNILMWAERHNLDPNMVATVMQIESCGDPRALSSAGAMGLFQVMPFHFQAGEDGYDPDTNALRGMNYLAERLIQTNGEVGHAFAGYNGGHVAAAGNWNSWAHETQRYYTWTTGVYSDALNGNRRSTTLDQWLAAGGASLCVQAEQRLGLN